MKLLESIKSHFNRLLGSNVIGDDVQTEHELDQRLSEIEPLADTSNTIAALQASVSSIQTSLSVSAVEVEALQNRLTTEMQAATRRIDELATQLIAYKEAANVTPATNSANAIQSNATEKLNPNEGYLKLEFKPKEKLRVI